MATSSSGLERMMSMSPARISGALLERLGERAAAELTGVLEAHRLASTEAAMTQCGERFERRLGEETSQLRLEISQLRGEMRGEFAAVRGEMREEFAAVRGEMREGFAAVRGEMREGFAAERFELLKWAVALWVGQLAAVAGIVTALLKTVSPRYPP